MTLTCVLRQLALTPEIQRKLRSELPPSGTPLTCANTTNISYLSGVVNEALRLWPALPSGAQALTPPAGYWIAGTYVPGNVAVRINHCALMTGFFPVPRSESEIERVMGGLTNTGNSTGEDERYFSKPTEFIPERWTTESHLVIDKRAFIPFS